MSEESCSTVDEEECREVVEQVCREVQDQQCVTEQVGEGGWGKGRKEQQKRGRSRRKGADK